MFIDRCGRLGARRACSPTNAYTGLYALDTFDVRNAFSVGGRLNVANIQLQDQLDSSLNETIMHFNPVIRATYKISSDVAAYAGFSEADRVPTPLELGSANPAQPCIIASFLVSDPPLNGAKLLVVGSQYYAGDGSNPFEQLSAYAVVDADADASYQVTANIQVHLHVNNVFDNHCYAYGPFFDTTEIPNFGAAGAPFTDPRTLSPAQPHSVYASLKATF